MRVSFSDLASAVDSSDLAHGTFLFTGSDYPYAAAKAFSEFVARKQGLPVEFHSKVTGLLSADSVHLFGTLGEEAIPFSQITKFDVCRIIPVAEGIATTKAAWGKLISNCFVVDVVKPLETTIEGDMQYMFTLMNVPFDAELLKKASKDCELRTSSILQHIEFSIPFGGLVTKEGIPPPLQEGEMSYNKFKDVFLFRNPLDISVAVLELKDPVEYTTRLLNDLAVYAAILTEDKEGETPASIASSYGQNIFFLKGKLLPRLRTLGMSRLLTLMSNISDMLCRILNGEVVDGNRQLSATILLAFRG
jgi:hypothetical protein